MQFEDKYYLILNLYIELYNFQFKCIRKNIAINNIYPIKKSKGFLFIFFILYSSLDSYKPIYM